jgi:hypothetical protein
VLEELAGGTCVLGQDEARTPEDSRGARPEVAEIADRSRDDIKPRSQILSHEATRASSSNSSKKGASFGSCRQYLGEGAMIVLLGASAIYLAGLQAGINAPRDAFTQCLKSVSAKAESAKVKADQIEIYIRTNCSTQIEAFKDASIAFDVKNGISRKEAISGADDMITGWLGDSIEDYKFRFGGQGEPQQAADALKAQSAPAAPVQPAAAAQPQP